MSEWTRWVRQFKTAKECMYPNQEFTHKVACQSPETTKSKDGHPSCEYHKNFNMKKQWKGFIEGA